MLPRNRSKDPRLWRSVMQSRRVALTLLILVWTWDVCTHTSNSDDYFQPVFYINYKNRSLFSKKFFFFWIFFFEGKYFIYYLIILVIGVCQSFEWICKTGSYKQRCISCPSTWGQPSYLGEWLQNYMLFAVLQKWSGLNFSLDQQKWLSCGLDKP